MNKKILFLALPLFLLLISSCGEEKDKVKEISKDGAIETVMNVEHINNQLDVVKTTHKIWVRNMLVKTAVHTDTIPSLGTMKENVENSDGESKEIDVKKDYEFYITVK